MWKRTVVTVTSVSQQVASGVRLSSIRSRSHRGPLTALRQRMRELAHTRVRSGYRRLLVLLRREGWDLGKKRCYRLYTEEGLAPRRRRSWRHATTAIVIAASVTMGAQQQAPNPRNAWPCGGRLDPSYFRVAEGSGEQLLLLAPDEIADSAPVLLAITSHPQTIFRLAGSITPDLNDFQIPIDSSVAWRGFRSRRKAPSACLRSSSGVVRPRRLQRGRPLGSRI